LYFSRHITHTAFNFFSTMRKTYWNYSKAMIANKASVAAKTQEAQL
jgi:hypothetical protein